jgi:hypothetical protein
LNLYGPRMGRMGTDFEIWPRMDRMDTDFGEKGGRIGRCGFSFHFLSLVR